ncbi:MAG TPA: heat-inducible transcriptional repressor HrcA [Acidimicrobiales bacterium]|nr:heat-inducible transcriptional repressor HrcA [Acidimicrobiales bacterium]
MEKRRAPGRSRPPTGTRTGADEETAEDAALDHRKAAILNAVVAEYIDTAQPVGSGHITGSPGVEVSSATVRSEMAALERDGYLVQPHTSAGRIPTDKGYRFFVDHLAAPGRLGPEQRQQVRQFFARVHGQVEDLLGRTSGLLADLTDYAAVVVGPGHAAATVRSAQLVGLAPRRALLVVVLDDGAVEKAMVELTDDTEDPELVAASARITALLRGRTLGAVPAAGAEDPATDAPVAAAMVEFAKMSAPEGEQVFVGGSSHMAAAFDAVDTVRSVLSILEQQLVVVELVEDVLDRGLSVAIGTEHGFEPLASCALVVAPVSVEGELAGTIGVLGPTRMDYPRALAAVHVVGERLGRHLEHPGHGEHPGGHPGQDKVAGDVD